MENKLSSEQISEMNIIIAKFMRWEYFDENWEVDPCKYFQDKSGNIEFSLRYDLDWNLLIEACKRFCELSDFVSKEVTRYDDDWFDWDVKRESVDLALTLYDKQKLFIALHDAVKWYNTIKK